MSQSETATCTTAIGVLLENLRAASGRRHKAQRAVMLSTERRRIAEARLSDASITLDKAATEQLKAWQAFDAASRDLEQHFMREAQQADLCATMVQS